MTTTMNRVQANLVRAGVKAQYIAHLPVASRDGHGLLDGVRVDCLTVDDDGAVLTLYPAGYDDKPADINDLCSPDGYVDVRMGWDDLGHHAHLWTRLADQHGDEATWKFFAKV